MCSSTYEYPVLRPEGRVGGEDQNPPSPPPLPLLLRGWRLFGFRIVCLLSVSLKVSAAPGTVKLKSSGGTFIFWIRQLIGYEVLTVDWLSGDQRVDQTGREGRGARLQHRLFFLLIGHSIIVASPIENLTFSMF